MSKAGVPARLLRSVLATLSLLILMLPLTRAQGAPAVKRIVPVVGSTPGAQGATFKTQLVLSNATGRAISGTMHFHPAGQAGSSADPHLDYDLAPYEVHPYDDIVAAMGQTGLGSLDIEADAGHPLPLVLASAVNVSEAGTTSGAIPVVSPEDALQANDRASIVSPSEPDKFRLNVGIRSLDEPLTLTVQVFTPQGAARGGARELTYPANYFEQVAGNVMANMELQPNDSLLFKIVSGRAFIFGSSTDNITNDPNIQMDQLVGRGPIAVSDAVETNEDTAVTVNMEGRGNKNRGMTFEIVSGPSHGTLGAIVSTGLKTASVLYTPNHDYFGPDSFIFRITDDRGRSSTAEILINVLPINDPPTAQNVTLNIDEDESGTVTLRGTDPDGDTLIFTIIQSPAHGTLGPLTGSSATQRSVVYTPTANYNGPDMFRFRVSDGTSFDNGTVTINIAPISDGPLANNETYSLNEDGSINQPAPGVLANDSDAESATLTATLISGPGIGSFALNPDGSFNFAPPADFFGTVTFTYSVTDGDGNSANATATLNVVAVNDAPAFTAGPGQTLNEDAGPQSIPWASGMTPGPGETQNLTFLITGNTNPALFSAGPSIASDGTLTFTSAPNEFGSATLTVVLQDDGGTANGGVDTSAPVSLTITVNPVNDEPSFTSTLNPSVNEDSGAQSIPSFATNLSAGPANESGQTLSFVVVFNNPSLYSATPDVDSSGTLTFTPAPDANGSGTVIISLRDDGGTANGGDDASPPVTFTITVVAVNDAPSFTPGADDSSLEDEGAQTVSNWATGISAGPSDESGQSLTFEIVSNDNPTLFSAGPTIASDGTLSYTAAADKNGTATITYRLRDGGGTANGGVDVTGNQSFTITVTAVNDAPSFTGGANQTVLEDSPGSQVVSGWATSISAGPADESGQVIDFILTNDNPGLFSVAPSINAAGDLSFTLTANAEGVANLTAAAHDNGGTANGGVDTSATQAFTITVTGVNDEPFFTAGANQTVNEDAGPQTVAGFVTGINAGAPSESGQVLTFTIDSNSNTALFLTAPSIASDGTLTYTTAADANGTATITYYLKDDGGTANSGDDQSATSTFTITVNPVNDAPVAVNDSYTTNEDTALVVADPGVLTNDTDADGDTLSAILVTAPSNGSVAPLIVGGTFAGFTYTPNSNFFGSDSFTYKANDGTADSATNATVSITVTSVNDAPVANDDGPYTVQAGTTFTLVAPGVLANDTDVEGSALNAVLVSGPADATAGGFTLNVDGSFSYTNDNTNGNTSTTDSFTYRANDGTDNSNVATVTLTIQYNVPPTGVEDAGTVDEGATLNVAAPGVLGNDTDPDGPSIQAILVSGPANATVGGFTLNADGSYSYTHNGSETISDSFVYKPNDSIADGNNTTVTITINPINDTPVAVADSYSTDEDTALNVVAPGVLVNDTDADSPSLNAVLVTGPTNAAPLGFTLNADGSFSYTPAADFSGTDSFEYKANDGTADSNTVTVTITVNSIDDTPTDIALSASTIVENQPSGTAIGTFTTTDPDGAPHTYTFVAGAGDTDNASFQIVSDQLRSAAVFDFETKSSYSIRVRTTDSTSPVGLFFEEQFTITVTNANEAPTDIALSNATLNENQPAGTLVGLLSTTDPDAADTFTYTLVSGAGDTGNASFQTVGNQLQTSGPLNFEVTPTLSVRIRSTDSGTPNLFFEEAFTITVTDVNEPPVADDDAYANVIGNTEHHLGDGSGPSGVVFHTHVSDQNPLVGDADPDTNPAFNNISIMPVSNADTSAGGKISIDADGTFTYTPPPGVTGVNSDFYDYTLTDGTNTDLGRLNFTITGLVWYVKNDDDVAPFEGTSTDPFNELSDGASDSLPDDAEDAVAAPATPNTVFVFKGDGTTVGMDQGIVLDANQNLLGAWVDLVIGGTTLVTGNVANIPNITNVNGNGVSFIGTGNSTNRIAGLAISGGGAGNNGIDATNSAGVVSLTIDTVNIAPSTASEGIDINVSGGETIIALSDVTVHSNSTGIDINETAGGIARVSDFSTIAIVGGTPGSGIIMNNVRFDTDANAGTNNPVNGLNLSIGAVGSPVGSTGMILTNVGGGAEFGFVESVANGPQGAFVIDGDAGTFSLSISATATLTANTGPALNLTDVAALISNAVVTSPGSGTTGVSLTNVTGSVTASGSIGNASGTDFVISGGNVNVTYNGTITDDLGQLVRIANTTGGTKLFTGAITDNFDGDGGIGGEGSIHLATNTGTINFSGGLSLSTAANHAFRATGGGTINVCAVNPCGGGGAVVNRLQTTSGTPLHVSGPSIGANGLTFQSIAASGALNGILLNTPGSLGGLTVTGTGAADSGGTIQSTSGDGISLNSTRDVSLTELQISSSGDNAIDATSVINLTLDSVDIATTANMGILGATVTDFKFQNGSTMTGAGNGANESGIDITDLLGANNAITSSSVTGSQTQNVRITNNVSTAGTLTITGSTFSTTSAANGSDAVSIIGNNAANLTVNLTGGNNLNNTQGDGIQVSANNSANVTATINGATSNYNGNLGSAVNIAAADSATITATVSGFTGVSTGTSSANGLNVFNIQNFNTSTINATVQNNTITGLGNNASGIRVIQEANGTINVNINNNNISGMAANGIVAQARAGTGGNGHLNMTVGPSNTINLASGLALDGVSIESGSSAGGDTNTVCLNMSNNSSAAAAQQGYRLRQRTGTTFNLQNFAGNGAVAADITTWVNTTKSNTGTTDVVIGTAFSNAPSPCPTP